MNQYATTPTPLRPLRAALTGPFTSDQAALIAPLIQQRLEILCELHSCQVAVLPPGCDAWADTADQIQALSRALPIVENCR